MLVIFDKTPGLSTTSNLVYAEKYLSSILQNLIFFSLLEIKRKFYVALRIDEISDIKADVVAAAPAPSP